MFPYTHICFARNVLKELDDEIILGAVFPDTVIAGFLDHGATHRRCGDIHNYLNRLGVFRNFALAAVTHGTKPQGLDYYCDEKYPDCEKGYAFEAAKPIVDKVVKYCNLPEQMGWWKAHNFIEMAAELWFARKDGDSYNQLARALGNQDMILAVSQLLAPFYDISAAKISMSFPIYAEYVLMDEVTPIALAALYGKQMTKKHGISIDVPAAAGLIEESLKLVENTLPGFMAHCEQEVSQLIEDLGQK